MRLNIIFKSVEFVLQMPRVVVLAQDSTLTWDHAQMAHLFQQQNTQVERAKCSFCPSTLAGAAEDVRMLAS